MTFVCVCVWVPSGRALPGRMSSQQGEAEGRSGNDAESAERHAEVSLSNRPRDHFALPHTLWALGGAI